MPPQPPRVFISYSHKNEVWKDRVVEQLGVLGCDGKLAIWEDRRIAGGDDWLPEIEQATQACDVALLLISASFLTSGFILREEVPTLLRRRMNEGVRVIPVILRACAWDQVDWLNGIQARPTDGKPLASMRRNKADEALAQLAKEVLRLVTGMARRPRATGQAVIAPTRLRHGAGRLFGREDELAALDRAWEDGATHVMTVVAWGGVGKTALLVEWMGRKARGGWAGFERVFDWSFYSQGTREEGEASADAFVAKALEFFGGDEGRALANSPASAWDKGAKLVEFVARQRSLLVLDGLEPLQYPPSSPVAGQLRDPAVETLLKGLAQRNPGLCVVTTREHVTDLTPFNGTTAPERPLEHLPVPAGIELLKTLGVRGTEAEYDELVEEVGGHALTLKLLGEYLVRAHKGDIRKRDLIKFEKADAKTQGGHAFKTMAAYETWLADGAEDGERALAVLRMLGLFDRPADAGCVGALRKEPAIAGLTEPLVGLSDEDWNLTLSALAECGLVMVGDGDASGGDRQAALDAHPLIREYFGKRLREGDGEAWRSGHRRLYEHLKDSTERWPDTLEGLQPLYQAVAHGCQAGMQQEACDEVYRDRILRGTNEFYSTKKLGAFGADLGAVACFFERPWSRVSDALSENARAWLLGQAGFRLRSLGRLTEALEPMRAGLEMAIEQEDWSNAARRASNLSELELTLGSVEKAVTDAERLVEYADKSGDAFQRMSKRTTVGDALHQRGRREEALERFREAEEMQAERQSEYPLLYSIGGFWYCDLLLGEAGRAAWRVQMGWLRRPGQEEDESRLDRGLARQATLQCCRDVEQRAARTLEWMTEQGWLLDIALDHLTLGRAALWWAIIEKTPIREPHAAIKHIATAVDGLRRAGQQDYMSPGLLSRAWLRVVAGDAGGARADLDEAWQIAERGPMRLHMADVHLYRARLFFKVEPYPWGSAAEDLAAARGLIEECGYGRRVGELEDAEGVILGRKGRRDGGT